MLHKPNYSKTFISINNEILISVCKIAMMTIANATTASIRAINQKTDDIAD